MKRFLVFAYDEYYPGGGLSDFRGEFDTLDELHESLPSFTSCYDFVDVLDLQERCQRFVEITEAGVCTTYVEEQV